MPKTTPKDIEKVKALLQTGFTEQNTLYPVTKYENDKSMIASNYTVYSFAALPALIEKMKRREENQYEARYTVEKNGNMWFTFEGRPGDNIEYLTDSSADVQEQAPAHSDMTPKPNSGVIASGIIVFSEQYQIERITNWSGHFRPYATTLVWPLAALLNLEADFTSEVALGFFWKNEEGRIKRKTVSLSKDQLHTLLPEECSITCDKACKTAVYSNGTWKHYEQDLTPESESKPKPKQKQKRSATYGSSSNNTDHRLKRTATTKSLFSSSSSSLPPPILPIKNQGSLIPKTLFNDEKMPIEEQKADISSPPSSSSHTNDLPPIAQQNSLGTPPSTPPRFSLFLIGRSARRQEPFSDCDCDESESESKTKDRSSCEV